MNENYFLLTDFAAKKSGQYGEYVTAVFQNIADSKKCSIILAVCQESVRKTNPLDVNIKEVARLADVSVGALYKYFTNRENMLQFTISFIRDYMLDVMHRSEAVLLGLTFTEALYYYCIGAASWEDSQKQLGAFFYRAVYSGESALLDSLVKPVSNSFKSCIQTLIDNAVNNGELVLFNTSEMAATLLYQSLVPIADSISYPALQHYFFPDGIREEEIGELISRHIKSIGTFNEG